jgi:hypothetical protein
MRAAAPHTLAIKNGFYVRPTSLFYELYNQDQQLDIITSLENYRELPVQYGYFGKGATYWDAYVKRLASENHPNSLKYVIEMLRMGQGYIDSWISQYERVNLVDIGVGNGMHVRNFLAYLMHTGKFGRYIGLDISPSMMEISKTHMREWFGNDLEYEDHLLDISYDRFNYLLSKEQLGNKAGKTTNIVLTTEGMIENLRSPDAAHQVISDSMGRDDLFINAHKLDTLISRKYFAFNAEVTRDEPSPHDRLVLDLLNIRPVYYSLQMGFDENKKRRYIRVLLNQDISIRFDYSSGVRVVELKKGETVTVWFYWHHSPTDAIQQFERNGFEPVQITQTIDQQYSMIMGRIKR